MFEVEDTREDTCNGYHSSDLMNSNRQRIDSFLGQISTVQFYCKLLLASRHQNYVSTIKHIHSKLPGSTQGDPINPPLIFEEVLVSTQSLSAQTPIATLTWFTNV